VDWWNALTPERRAKIRRVLRTRQKTLTLVLNNIHDLHNVSAILRSCDAFGVPEVHLLYTREKFPVLGAKSSASAKKWVATRKYADAQDLVKRLREQGFGLVRTGFSSKAISLTEWNFTQPTAVVLGNEHRGVEQELIKLIPDEIYIPMYGMVQSFNVSVASAIILYEAWRQRESKGMYASPSYTQEELKEMELAWARK